MIDNTALCDDGRLQQILAIAAQDSADGVLEIERALVDYPQDARLFFLRGSLLIGLRRFIEAHEAMAKAIEIAPDFHLARFQLGFFELTSGEADAAILRWQPLKALPDNHWIRYFVAGLEHLIADQFQDCIAALRAGIAVNTENLPLNRDMELIIAQCEDILGSKGEDDQTPPDDDVSATSMLLGSFGSRGRN